MDRDRLLAGLATREDALTVRQLIERLREMNQDAVVLACPADLGCIDLREVVSLDAGYWNGTLYVQKRLGVADAAYRDLGKPAVCLWPAD